MELWRLWVTFTYFMDAVDGDRTAARAQMKFDSDRLDEPEEG